MRGYHTHFSIFTCLIASTLPACDMKEPSMSDEEVRELRDFFPAMSSECIEIARYGGLSAVSGLPTDQCFEMSRPRQFHGLWLNDFEGSRFCSEPAANCGYETPREKVWLSYSPVLRQREIHPKEGCGGLYHIVFEGRITTESGRYGHAGTAAREVIVDRIEKVRLIRNTPDQYRCK